MVGLEFLHCNIFNIFFVVFYYLIRDKYQENVLLLS